MQQKKAFIALSLRCAPIKSTEQHIGGSNDRVLNPCKHPNSGLVHTRAADS